MGGYEHERQRDTSNVGALTPTAHGDYYAWGDTLTKAEYTKRNCATYVTYGGTIEDYILNDEAASNKDGHDVQEMINYFITNNPIISGKQMCSIEGDSLYDAAQVKWCGT